MCKLVNRIKLKKLYSYPEVFEPIIFHEGVNIILGEKYDSNTIKGRKTNGVGKSMSIEFLNFCLLKKYSESRVKNIPEDILSNEVYIKLDIEIGKSSMTISRKKSDEENILINKGEESIKFESLEDAKKYLSNLLYNDIRGMIVPSFREMIALVIRDERSEFSNILKTTDINRNIPVDYIMHLFLLNIQLDTYINAKKIIKQIDDVNKMLKKIKDELTNGNTRKMSDVKIELNSLDDELKKMNNAIESFKTNETFEIFEKELIEIEELLERLRRRQKALKYELKKIDLLPQPEKLNDEDISMVYNEYKNGLGDYIVKSLDETLEFKNKIESFQRILINERAIEIKSELNNLSNEIRKLDEEYSEKLNIIDKKGTLKNLKTGLKIFNEKQIQFSKQKGFYNEYMKSEKEKKILQFNKSEELIKLDSEIEEKQNVIDSFLATISQIHELIMGNKECSFDITTVNNNRSKQVVNIDLRTFDDGSHSVNRSKVFIYDMSLLFNEYTKKRHPGFLVHDNIFDVDQDTLIQSLNFLSNQEEKYTDFQYILTVNRDKIENEERAKAIKLDIEEHKVATFTKKNKFLKKDYQEL